MRLHKQLQLFVKNMLKEIYELRFNLNRQPSIDKHIINELKANGIVTIPNFLPKEKCDYYIKEFDSNASNSAVKKWNDDVGADTRLFGFEKVTPDSLKIIDDDFINSASLSYLGYKTSAKFLLAGRIQSKEGNLGSGGGWHRDDAVRKQFKAIIYLNDVDDKNGPFQYIVGSHKLRQRIKLFLKGQDFYQSRYNEEVFANDTLLSKIKDVKGNKGDLILVDTKGLHRGKPIDIGVRYALTLYSWRCSVPEHIQKLLN